MYKFYFRMDSQTFGPYSAKESLKLGLLNKGTLVREERMEEWLPTSKIDFEDMAKQEMKEILSESSTPKIEEGAKCQKLKARPQSSSGKGELVPTPEFSQQITRQPIQQWPTLKFMANFFEGFYAISGKIIITATQLIFKAYFYNLGDRRDRVFEICDIVGYKKGILTQLYISFADGNTIKLAVWSKQRIINELEARRQYLIQH